MPRSRSSKRDSDLLGALIADAPAATTDDDLAATTERFFDTIPGGKLIPIERLHEWADQPRKVFNEERLAELAASIADAGVLEPLIVRRDPVRVGHYLVTAGMRRLLAARRVRGAEDPVARGRVAALPCVIREAAEPEAFADALVENLVRQDLTRREVMDAVATLQHHYGWGPREIGRRTGRDHKDISELLRVAADAAVAPLVADELITVTAAGALVERRNLPVRETVLEAVRAGSLRTGAQIDAALEQARARLSASTTERIVVRAEEYEDDISPEAGAAVHEETDRPDSQDRGAETTVVRAHERRLGASTRAEALARDIITFVAERPLLDHAALLKLSEAREALDALIAAGPRRPGGGRGR